MTSVSVWDREPSIDELLHARTESGWAPTATDTVDGPVVMGHAACLVPVVRAESEQS